MLNSPLILCSSVNCPKGTRYRLSLGKCEPCGQATYQDEEGQQSCKLCPPDTTTVSVGAIEQGQCQGESVAS